MRYELPNTMYAVMVAGRIIAMFTDDMEASTYLRVLRGPESEVRIVSLRTLASAPSNGHQESIPQPPR